LPSDFARRLLKNAARLAKWSSANGVSCYRVYDRDIPSVPMALDRYEAWLVAHVFEPRHGIAQATIDSWMTEARAALAFSPERTVVKRRSPGSSYEKIDERGERIVVHEGGLRFLVNVFDYLDTGLFLDHRQTRARVRSMSAGKRVLNLFAYTGAFSVYAAAGGAAKTVSVDLSPAYCAWARENFAENELGSENVVVNADVMDWLAQSREQFDLAVIDPPTVSRSKRAASFEVQRDHMRLLDLALDHAPEIIFSTNFTGFTLEFVRDDVVVDEISRATVPFDFARKPPIHRAWSMRKRAK
jgi:23S rRNA G2069 N7-methylase RlmK/C1962 C5-methylase RlmI